ncbi:MAG: CSLREA domain-containing protein [Dokdonella sp.]
MNRSICRRSFTIAAMGLNLMLTSPFAAATTITVNSITDVIANDGQCTLREAMNAANGNIASGAMPNECAAGQAAPIVDTIAFNIPGTGAHTIAPTSNLPEILEIVTIDGYTQPGASPNTLALGDNAAILIVLDASHVSGTLFGLHGGVFGGGDAGGSTFRGLSMQNLTAGSAFSISTSFGDGAHDIAIAGNFIGTDPNPGNQNAIYCISSSGWKIGGSTPAARNVIATGGSDEIFLNNCTGSSIQGNYIGIRPDGSAALGSPGNSIELTQGSNNNLIGGSIAGEGNVIAGASASGININGNCDGNVIKGNLIGTDALGTSRMGSNIGINLGDVSNTTVGGPAPGEGNVISGNVFGIQIGLGSATTVQGNKIGTDPSGTLPVINAVHGIQLTGGASTGSSIGGINPGEGNTIAFSCGNGISFNQPAMQWPILGNSIHSNGGLGISLAPGIGPTTNDPGDADSGANNLQNYPVITAAVVNAGSATVSGTLDSTPNTSFMIEVFAGIDCNRSGFGEGQTFVGSTMVTTDATGNASFGPELFGGVPAGETAITLTATDPDGDTSEFSECVGGIGRVFANGFEPQCW